MNPDPAATPLHRDPAGPEQPRQEGRAPAAEPTPDPHHHDPADPALADETWLRPHLRDHHGTDIEPSWRLAVLLAAHEEDHPDLQAAAPPRPARAYDALRLIRPDPPATHLPPAQDQHPEMG